jgi:hypothetical protein
MTTLDKNEKAIIAGFRTMNDAEKTEKELKKLGVIDLRIDRMSLYNVTEFEERNINPITGDFPGLAMATFDRDFDKDASILTSAHPSASGMSDGNARENGIDVVLTVVVSNKKFDQAEKIVRGNGGQF